MTRINVRFAVAAWILATATISACDHVFHVRTGVLRYHWEPFVDGQSVWVVAVFGGAVATMLWLAWLLPQRAGGVRWPALTISIALFGAFYFASGELADDHPTWLLLGGAAVWLVHVLAAGADRLAVVVASAVLGVLGPLGEGLFSALGLFDYAESDVFRVPLWLALLWMNGAFIIAELARGLRSPISGN